MLGFKQIETDWFTQLFLFENLSELYSHMPETYYIVHGKKILYCLGIWQNQFFFKTISP